MNAIWQTAKFAKIDQAAEAVFKSWKNHHWYLDPSAVVMVIALIDH